MISFITNKTFFFSFVVIQFLTNELNSQKQNISKNENYFNETINQNSLLNLTANASDLKDITQTNGRMRSFLAEEEEVLSHKLFEFKNESGYETQTFKAIPKFSQNLKNTYSYPIFNYQIDSDMISHKMEKENLFSNISNSEINLTVEIPKRPRYRFKNSSKSIKSLFKPFFQTANYSEDLMKFQFKINENRNNYTNDENLTETNKILRSHHSNDSQSNDLRDQNSNQSFVTKWSKISHFRNKTERFCISSTDCDIELNERCIDRNKYSICGCKEPFFRENVSQKCQIKKLIRLLFKVSFDSSNQLNSNSLEFIQFKYSIERNIWSVVMNSSHLLTVVDNIKVIELIDSKIVVDFYVKIANPNNNFHHKYIEYHFWYRLMSTIKGIDFNSNENLFDLRAVEVVDDIDYCSVKELNYCSDSAVCADNNDSETKFQCKCKSGLTDLSPNIKFKGEICALRCNSDLCGAGGVCHIRNHTEIQCICMNWKFGDRCQYSLYAFLCVAALFVIISIFFSVCLATIYCGYKINEEFNKLRSLIQHNHSNGENSLRLI